jgi:hypothetical protein
MYFIFILFLPIIACKICSTTSEETRTLAEEELKTINHSSEWLVVVTNQNKDAMWMYGKANELPMNKTVIRMVNMELVTQWYIVLEADTTKNGF